MKYFPLVLILLMSNIDLAAEPQSVRVQNAMLNKSERAGVRYHKKGEFKKAFEKLDPAAEAGFKQAQYLLGIMCLKGQFLPQSLETGMGWLGVANEIDIADWARTYESIYQMGSAKQKKAIDERVKSYIQLYGLEAQNMVCSYDAKLGSRKTEMVCNKRLGKGSPLMELENPAAISLE